jgi:hypothetical protein
VCVTDTGGTSTKVPSESFKILAKWSGGSRKLFIMLNRLLLTGISHMQERDPLQIKKHSMDVLLCPLSSVKAGEHAACWIFLCPVVGVAPLAGKEVITAAV